MTTPRFEFDPEKDRQNLRKHGISLASAEALWRVRHVVAAARTVEGELRYAIIGKLGGRIWVALFTLRSDSIRLISCHRAGGSWRRRYEEASEVQE